MNTNISREELYDKFVTKEYLHEQLELFLADFKTVVQDVAELLRSRISDTDTRLDQHIMQNALEHSKFKKA